MPPKSPKIGTTNHFYSPGHSWTTPGVFIGDLSNSYMNPSGEWDFSDLILFAPVNDEPVSMMIDTVTKQIVLKEKVMSCCLGAKKVKIPEYIAASFLDEEPNLFEGVEVEFV